MSDHGQQVTCTKQFVERCGCPDCAPEQVAEQPPSPSEQGGEER